MTETTQNGCILADGQHYLSFLANMHEKLKPEWYLEIGTQTGASLMLSSAKSISVDPDFRLRHEVIGDKPELLVFQETSDAFFEAGRLGRLDVTVDLAFLDGMHLFEFLLRDFIGTERHCSRDGVIILHDCLPRDIPMTSRNRRDSPTRSWTGDVWKLVPVLQKYRPDLTIEIIDAAPTGLVVVSDLDPASRVLGERYNDILQEWIDVNLGEYGVEKYYSGLEVIAADSSRWISEFPRELGHGWETKPDICIKIAAATQKEMVGWGDYHFARGLARAFARKGHRVSISSQERWYANTTPGGIDLVLRGRAQVNRVPGRLCLFWAISKTMRTMNYDQADHIFWASPVNMARAEDGLGKGISSLLPQAFDSSLMSPGVPDDRDEIVFVGRARHGYERAAVKYAVSTGEDVKIWGPDWGKTHYADYVIADGVTNSDLPKIYQSARIVLNDHTPTMKSLGIVSNRVFDALACGAIPVSEDVGYLPDTIEDYVYTFSDEDSFQEAMKAAKSEDAAKRKQRAAFAASMSELHSFDARAEAILEVATQLKTVNTIAAE